MTFYKRKKGLLKKAIQLSVLCESRIFLSLFQKSSGKLVVYNSHELDSLSQLFQNSDPALVESYSIDDVNQIIKLYEFQYHKITNQNLPAETEINSSNDAFDGVPQRFKMNKRKLNKYEKKFKRSKSNPIKNIIQICGQKVSLSDIAPKLKSRSKKQSHVREKIQEEDDEIIEEEKQQEKQQDKYQIANSQLYFPVCLSKLQLKLQELKEELKGEHNERQEEEQKRQEYEDLCQTNDQINISISTPYMNTTIDQDQMHGDSKSEVMSKLKNRFKFEPLNIDQYSPQVQYASSEDYLTIDIQKKRYHSPYADLFSGESYHKYNNISRRFYITQHHLDSNSKSIMSSSSPLKLLVFEDTNLSNQQRRLFQSSYSPITSQWKFKLRKQSQPDSGQF